MSAQREFHHSLGFFKSHSVHTVKLWNNSIIQKCGEGKGFYGFAVVCNPWDKAEKPLRRERMSSQDGGIRGGQRTILEETGKMNSVHFTRCCLLAIIVKYSRQSLRGSGSDTFSFLSRRRKCESCSIISTIHYCQTSTRSILQTYFLHNLFLLFFCLLVCAPTQQCFDVATMKTQQGMPVFVPLGLSMYNRCFRLDNWNDYFSLLAQEPSQNGTPAFLRRTNYCVNCAVYDPYNSLTCSNRPVGSNH